MKNSVPYLAAAFAIMVWSVTFASTRVLLFEFSSLEILLVRFSLAWAVLRVWELASTCARRRREVRSPSCCAAAAGRPSRKCDEWLFAGMGFTGVAAYQFLENCAIYYTNASNIAIFVSFGPIATAIIAWLVLHDRVLSFRFVLGSILSVCGVALVSLNGVAVLKLRPIGDLMALGAMLSWGVYSILVDVANRWGVPPVVAIRKSFFWSVVMIVPFAVWGATESGFCMLDGSFSVNLNVQDNIDRFSNFLNWANIAFLGVLASAVCFALWNIACKGLGVVRATVGLYLTPIIGVLFAVMFLGERVAPMGVVGGMLIVAGVAVAGRGMKKEVDK